MSLTCPSHTATLGPVARSVIDPDQAASRNAVRPNPKARRPASVVLRTLADPGADRGAIAGGKLLLAVRHTRLRRAAPVEQPHQVAAVGVLRHDHGAELRALHQPLVSGQIEAALFESL